jgi:hypothetical protein
MPKREETVPGVKLDPVTYREQSFATKTFRLDMTTYTEDPSKLSGRWFNVPIVNPSTGRVMEDDEALRFATERGYLGQGFSTEKLARTYSGIRRAEGAKLGPFLAVFQPGWPNSFARNLTTPLPELENYMPPWSEIKDRLNQFIGGQEGENKFWITEGQKIESDRMLARLVAQPYDGRDLPYNIGGRAPDGFHYVFLDKVMINLARDEINSKIIPPVGGETGPIRPPVRTEGLPDFAKPLIGMAP